MKKIVVILVAIINIAAFYYGVRRINYDILLPGGISEVVDKVEIESTSTQEGSFYTVYVYGLDRPTKLMTLLAEPLIGVDSYEMSASYSKLSNAQIRARGDLLYDTGFEYSLIHAYNEAEREIDYFLEYISIVYFDSDYNPLDIGLEIWGVDGVEIESYNGFLETISSLEEATLNTNQGDYDISRTNGIFGFSVTPNYKINSSSPTFEIQNTSVSGSSGGLLQTLSIFNSLTDFDYTYGLKIAGTGTISVTGHVGAIGGVEQKVIAASREDVDVFFIPEVNYEEALLAKEALKLEINIVGVATFAEAVEYLKEFGG